ncbi:hypothetical protein [Kitasatospora sp. NPDC090091]|uniref:hypothetical protein n=1 Tax=Kitasatospora sp. NPDC090091 TaxID=3364081 RepID=UPI0037F7105C
MTTALAPTQPTTDDAADDLVTAADPTDANTAEPAVATGAGDPQDDEVRAYRFADVLALHSPVAGPDTGLTPTRCAFCTDWAGTPVPWPCPVIHDHADIVPRPNGWELHPRYAEGPSPAGS